MKSLALALLAPHADTIKTDETGEVIAATLEALLDTVDDEMGDYLYENWDEILDAL